MQSEEGERRRNLLWSLVDRVKNGLVSKPWKVPVVRSAIIPLIVGDEAAAIALASELARAGIFIPAIRFPAVARGQARLRLTLSAAHTESDVAALLGALELCCAKSRST